MGEASVGKEAIQATVCLLAAVKHHEAARVLHEPLCRLGPKGRLSPQGFAGRMEVLSPKLGQLPKEPQVGGSVEPDTARGLRHQPIGVRIRVRNRVRIRVRVRGLRHQPSARRHGCEEHERRVVRRGRLTSRRR